MISKMRDDEAGSRIGIVMNGSPLFTGGAGSGESEIRRWMLENDWVEAIIALPTDLFYNTGIQTYVWLLTNRKPDAPARQGAADRRQRRAVLEVDAQVARLQAPRDPRRGARRDRAHLCRHAERRGRRVEVSKIFDTTDFGYREIRVERPLRLNFQVERRADRAAARREAVPEAGRG